MRLPLRRAVGLSKTRQIVVDFTAQPGGKFLPGRLGRALRGGSVSRCSGQPSIAAAQAFQARPIKRRAVLFDARAVVSVR